MNCTINVLCKTKFYFACLLSIFIFSRAALADQTVLLSSLDLTNTQQEWGDPHADKSVDGHGLSIGGRKFDNGLGTHATSYLRVQLDGNAKEFQAWVGVDDEEAGQPAMITFSVIGDGKTLWQSGMIKSGDAAKQVDVDLSGVKKLLLFVNNGGDDISFDHADWADARFVMAQGAPETLPPPPPEPAVILTPPSGPEPEIHGPKVYGCRPGHPFLYTIPVTGDRPMKFSAKGLPHGLKLDTQTGSITGTVNKRGEYLVTFRAKNKLGTAQKQFTIICGDKIALTPPMGWNSWNCFASAVTEEKVKSAADAMVSSSLINHGWTYINV
ncbi:MAG TPA: NPCBM/NEW2 domain-containing protein, partial [Candidatus Acidoferrum sp.]|nr:NPCBM/NEW2 domain-containing protein [Candidatus Acidoferrum sp.]